MSLTDKLPRRAIPYIKHLRDEFHVRTGLPRFGAGVALETYEEPGKLLLITSELYDKETGELYMEIQLPGGGVPYRKSMSKEARSSRHRPHTPLYQSFFLDTALAELEQEAGVSPEDVELTGKTVVNTSDKAGPDQFMIFGARATIDAVSAAITKGPCSNEVDSVLLYSLDDIGELRRHHAVDRAFDSLLYLTGHQA